jgi:hypothetical protein
MGKFVALASAASSLALLLGAGSAAAAITYLCTETGGSGCVMTLPITGSTITVASDGEASFDPFGAGYDTSDGIQLDSIWVGLKTAGWNLLAGTNTWVLPACDAAGTCENGPVNEPVGVWIAPGYTLTVPTITYGIYEDPADGGGLSDIVTLYNDANGTVNISFDSNAVPEPAAWGMMLVGFAAVGALARRRKQMALAA